MANPAVSQSKIPTKNPQLRLVGDKHTARRGARARSGRNAAQVGGDTRVRRSRRTGWLPGWRRLWSGWPRTRRGWNGRAVT